jgi:hypothetical protein
MKVSTGIIRKRESVCNGVRFVEFQVINAVCVCVCVCVLVLVHRMLYIPIILVIEI